MAFGAKDEEAAFVDYTVVLGLPRFGGIFRFVAVAFAVSPIG